MINRIFSFSILFTCFLLGNNNQKLVAQTSSVTIQYSGWTTQCCPQNTSNYQCFNNPGGSGVCGTSATTNSQSFFDPVPAGNIVTNITVNMYSAGCGGATVTTSINSISLPAVVEGSTGCYCDNNPWTIYGTTTQTFPCGISGYNYGANNNFNVGVSGAAFCVDYMTIIMTYANANQANPAFQPGSITGQATPCSGSSQTYSITNVSNATSYNWTVPAGWTITSGQTNTTMTVTVGASAGQVCVTASNLCGTSAPTCLSVSTGVNSTAPSSASASPNPICSGSTTLTVSGGSLGTGASWNWYTGSCGGSPAGTGSSVSVSPSSTTTYYVLAQGTCNTTSCATVTVTFNTPSTDPTSATATPTSICGGSSTLNVSGGTLGTGAVWNWYSGSCNGTLVGTGSSVSVSPGSTTTYFVNASGTCNTTNCASVTLTVDAGATATAGPAASTCGTTPFTLAGSIGGTATSLTWTTSGTGTFSNPNSPNAIYTPSAGDASSGSVTLTLTTDDPPGACLAASSNLVLTFEQAATALAGSDNTICAGDPFSLAGSIGGSASSLTWSTSGTGTFNNAAIGNAIYTPSPGDISAGTVYLIITTNDPAGACTPAADTLVLTLSTAPTAVAGPASSVCSGSSFPLNGTIGGSATSSTWTTSGTGTFNNPALVNAIYTPSGGDIITGTVTLTLTTNDPPGSCTSATDNFVLTIEPAATANAGTDASVCEGNTYTLSGSIGGSATALNWTTSGTGNFSNPSIGNAVYTPSGGDLASGSITLIITTNDPIGSCNAASDTIILTLDSLDNAGFSFSPATYCQAAPNPTPSLSGLPGGVFSGVPGIIIDPSTGEINLAASTIGGPYTITYTTNGTCPNISTFNVFITNSPDPTFGYSTTQYCQTDADPAPVFVPPASAGIFNASPAGLVFVNPTTGVIDVSSSTPGIYVITNNISGSSGCPDTSANTTIEIVLQADATITPAGPFCLGNAPVNLTAAQNGGTWSGNGITNPATGTFDPATAGVGTWLITYDILGFCGNNDTVLVIVDPNGDATINPVGSLCSFDSPAPLTAAQPGGVWSGTGVVGSNFDPSVSGFGTFVITYTIGGACGDIDTDTVTVIQEADATINPAGPFCAVELPVNLTSVQSGGIWTGIGITNTTLGTFDPSVPTPGVPVTITYIINGLCPDTGTIQIVVTPKLDATITSDSIFCDYYPSDTLTAVNSTGTDIWKIGSSFITIPPVFFPASIPPGVYQVIHTISGICGDTAYGTLTIINTPEATINIPAGFFCNNSDTIQLTAFDTGGFWTGAGIIDSFTGLFDPADSSINPPSTVTITHFNADPSGMCSSTATIDIFVGKVPPPPLTFSDTACFDNVLELFAQDTSLLGSGMLNWWYYNSSGIFVLDSSNGMGTSSYFPLVIDNVADSVYVFYVQEQNNNCPSGFSVCSLMVVNIGASFDATPPDSGEIPLQVIFANTSFGTDTSDHFLWTFGDGDTSIYFNPAHTYEDTGVFTITLTVTDQFGVCIADTTYSIYAKGTSMAEPPNIFTPNEDGTNDVFNLIHKNLTVVEGIIYNRWGELIFQWSSVEAGWDGRTLSGTKAPDGVYYYLIKAIGKDRPDPDQKTYEFAGHVTLVR